jgi:hypothetical protein
MMRESQGAEAGASTPTRRVSLFLASSTFGGVGAVVGSLVGHAIGALGVRAGAIVGGGFGVVLATTLARHCGWIDRRDYTATTAGALAGFLCAVVVALSTMRSPIGPLASTSLIGAGALAGAAYSSRARALLERLGHARSSS